MPSYERPLSFVIERIKATSMIEVEDEDGDGEWFLLTSDHMSDVQVFQVLKGRWSIVVSSSAEKFALVHCQMGPRSGVWLHYLDTPLDQSQYLAGCHQIASW